MARVRCIIIISKLVTRVRTGYYMVDFLNYLQFCWFLTYESTLVRILLMLVLIALEMARKDAVLTQKMMMKSMFSVDLLLETL